MISRWLPDGPKRAWRGRTAVVLALATFVLPTASAHADSLSTEVETAPQCLLGAGPVPCALETARVAQEKVEAPAWSLTHEAIASVNQSTHVDPSDPRLMVSAVTAQLVAQVNRLTDLVEADAYVAPSDKSSRLGAHVRAPAGLQFDAAYELRVRDECISTGLECLPVLLIAYDELGRGEGAYPFNMTMITDVPKRWYPERNEYRIDGVSYYQLFQADWSPRQGWDFFGTSQWASVTPLGDTRLTELKSYFEADDENSTELVIATPGAVRDVEQDGSTGVQATLGKDGNGIGLSRNWFYFKGKAGGSPLAHGTYWTSWKANGSGIRHDTLEESGVATWKQPTDTPLSWWVGSLAWYKNK